MADYIAQNRLIAQESLTNAMKTKFDNEISPNINTYITFPKIALARSSSTPNSRYENTYKTSSKTIGCGCGGTNQTIYEIQTIPGQTLNGLYAIELTNLFQSFTFNPDIQQYGIISCDPFVELTSTVLSGSGSYTAKGLKGVANLCRDIRQYYVNLTYYGSFHNNDRIIDLGFFTQNIISGVGVLNQGTTQMTTQWDDSTTPPTALSIEQLTWLSVNGIVDTSIPGVSVDGITDDDAVHVAGKIIKPNYHTSITDLYQFEDIVAINQQVSKDSALRALDKIITDWKTYAYDNAYKIDMYVCHYNCYMDSSDSGGGGGGSTTTDCIMTIKANMQQSAPYRARVRLESPNYPTLIGAATYTWCKGKNKKAGVQGSFTNSGNAYDPGGTVDLWHAYSDKYGGEHDNKIKDQSVFKRAQILKVSTCLGDYNNKNNAGSHSEFWDEIVANWCNTSKYDYHIFDVEAVTLTFNTNGSSTASTTLKVEKNVDYQIAVSNPKDINAVTLAFKYWTTKEHDDEGAKHYAKGDTIPAKSLEADLTLWAWYDATAVTLKYYVGDTKKGEKTGSSPITDGRKSLMAYNTISNSEYSLSSATECGFSGKQTTSIAYTFIGWGLKSTDTVPTYDPTPSSGSDKIRLTEKTTSIYALYGEAGYTLTFKKATGSDGKDYKETTQKNTPYIFNAPSAYGFTVSPTYTFKWYGSSSTASGGYTENQSASITAAATLYVVSWRSSYALTFKANKGTGGDKTLYAPIATPAATAPSTTYTFPTAEQVGFTREGMHIKHWGTSSTSSSGIAPGTSTRVNADDDYYAIWEYDA